MKTATAPKRPTAAPTQHAAATPRGDCAVAVAIPILPISAIPRAPPSCIATSATAEPAPVCFLGVDSMIEFTEAGAPKPTPRPNVKSATTTCPLLGEGLIARSTMPRATMRGPVAETGPSPNFSTSLGEIGATRTAEHMASICRPEIKGSSPRTNCKC